MADATAATPSTAVAPSSSGWAGGLSTRLAVCGVWTEVWREVWDRKARLAAALDTEALHMASGKCMSDVVYVHADFVEVCERS